MMPCKTIHAIVEKIETTGLLQTKRKYENVLF
jgi:hypothetical protein